MPSVWANSMAASKVASWGTAMASIRPASYRPHSSGGHAVVAQPAGVDGGGDEVVPQGVHLDNWGHLGGVAVIKGVNTFGQRRRGRGLYRHQAGALAVFQVLAQEGQGNAAKVRAAAHAADHHVWVFTGQVHLLEGFLADHGLVQEHVVEHGSQAVFLAPA